jgi:hypothetical protein
MATPLPGYERPTGPLGRSGRGAVAVAVAVVIFLAVVSLKPWDPSVVTPVASPRPVASEAALVEQPSHAVATAAGVPTPASTQPTDVTTDETADVSWPALPAAISPADAVAATEDGLGDLRRRAGTWGVWVAGAGPRILREEPWTDWVAVRPEPATSSPLNIALWPGTEVCERLPVLSGAPRVVAVTTPSTLRGVSRIDGWWTDGAHVASLSGSLGYISPPERTGRLTSQLLVRVDGATWPAGRYELHVPARGSVTALTFCIATVG